MSLYSVYQYTSQITPLLPVWCAKVRPSKDVLSSEDMSQRKQSPFTCVIPFDDLVTISQEDEVLLLSRVHLKREGECDLVKQGVQLHIQDPLCPGRRGLIEQFLDQAQLRPGADLRTYKPNTGLNSDAGG
jgi:hypothetical protein